MTGKKRLIGVDIETGEAIFSYDDMYEVCEYKGASSKELRGHKATSIPPESATHIEQVEGFMKSALDGRITLVTVNNARKYFDAESGLARVEGRSPNMTKAQLNLLNILINNLMYRNVIIGNRVEVCEMLSIPSDKLHKRLGILKGLVKVYTSHSGMMLGQVKILVHPAYGFKYSRRGLLTARERCINMW